MFNIRYNKVHISKEQTSDIQHLVTSDAFRQPILKKSGVSNHPALDELLRCKPCYLFELPVKGSFGTKTRLLI